MTAYFESIKSQIVLTDLMWCHAQNAGFQDLWKRLKKAITKINEDKFDANIGTYGLITGFSRYKHNFGAVSSNFRKTI